MPRILFAVSHHGYGHFAQTAPVIQALHARAPRAEILLRTALSRTVLAPRLDFPFRHLDTPSDCNFVMHDSIRLDLPASLEAYRHFHRDWPERVAAEARLLLELGVDLVFSNIGYLPLAAAGAAGIPAVAMSSINWADLFRHYLGDEEGAAALYEEMAAAYRAATLYLRPCPAMPMAAPGRIEEIPPIAQRGVCRRAGLHARLGFAAGDRLVIVGLGGIPHRVPVDAWPAIPGVKWLLPDAWPVRRPDARPFSAAAMPFIDLLASCDALITKPGYGSFAEAAAHAVPVLYLPRPDWPETPALVDWLERNTRARELAEADFLAGRLGPALDALWARPPTPPAALGGAEAAAERLLTLL